MISMAAAALAISITKGLIKLGGRLDVLMAERTTTAGPLIIPMPPVTLGPPLFERAEKLKKYVDETAGQVPDPLGPDRPRLVTLLAQTPPPNNLDMYFRRIFPKDAEPPLINPDAEYLKALKLRLPTMDWSDEATRQAAFAIASGRDTRQLSYAARTALLVVDTLAEFGAENTALFVRDENLQTVVQSVLERFANPQLEDFDTWNPFLRHALSATLNGVLDASDVFTGRSEWLDAVLTALALAREDAGGDDFVLGLLQGRGYRLLISQGLIVATEHLGKEQAGVFQHIAADVLLAAAPLVKTNTAGFDDFFREHWGDLLRAGLSALERQGPALLEGQSPLLKETLLVMIGELAQTTDTEFFTTDTVYKLAEAALGVVASDPDLLKPHIKEVWFRELITGVAQTVSDTTIRATFSREGLEHVVRSALTIFAAHPELLVDKPGLQFEVVRDVLHAVAGLCSFDARAIASAAVSGTFGAMVEHPALIGTRYGELIAGFSGLMAKQVAAKTITGVQATDLVTIAAEAMLRNPMLFTALQDNLASAIIDAVLQGAKLSETELLAGTTLVSTVREILQVLARRGRDAIADTTLQEFTANLTDAVAAGLERAKKEMGRRIDRERLPRVLGGVVAAFVHGDLTVLDAENTKFQELFVTLAEEAA